MYHSFRDSIKVPNITTIKHLGPKIACIRQLRHTDEHLGIGVSTHGTNVRVQDVLVRHEMSSSRNSIQAAVESLKPVFPHAQLAPRFSRPYSENVGEILAAVFQLFFVELSGKSFDMIALWIVHNKPKLDIDAVHTVARRSAMRRRNSLLLTRKLGATLLFKANALVFCQAKKALQAMKIHWQDMPAPVYVHPRLAQ